MADISQELIIISNGRYGRDIRQAIYDALTKVNSGGGGGGGDLSDYYTKEEVDEKFTDYYDKSSVDTIVLQMINSCEMSVERWVDLHYYNQTYIDENIPTNLAMTQTIGAAQNETLRLVDNTHYTKTQVDNLIASIDSMSHVVCTQSEYDAMAEHDTDTLYFVKGESSVTLYLGDLPVNTGGGSSTPNTTGGSGLYSSGPIESVAGTNEEG